jgi:hypothetical protein
MKLSRQGSDVVQVGRESLQREASMTFFLLHFAVGICYCFSHGSTAVA